MTFKEQIQQGIPDILPNKIGYDLEMNHAPKRKDILSADEKKVGVKKCIALF